MHDPLSDMIKLLRPRTVFSKGTSGAGRWAVRYGNFGHPGYCLVMEGSCRLAVDGQEPITMEAGDFVLLPATPGFMMSSIDPGIPTFIDPKIAATPHEEVRHGRQDGDPDVRMLGGYFIFDSPDADLLVSLLPAIVHVHDADRLTNLVQMVRDEAGAERPGRDLVLSSLLEILLVEALRTIGKDAPPGLLRGLDDPRLSAAIRQMHADPAYPWTTAQLAKEAALSRSAFFDRFTRHVGLPPMEYLVGWRMAIAKDLLRRADTGLADIAEQVGYGSASAFSTAFSRHVGQPPARYARAQGRTLK